MNELYTVRQLAADLWTIEEDMVRCFVLSGPQGNLLIDTCASGGDSFTEIAKGISPGPFSIILTHSDPDHIAGIPETGIPAMHPAEIDRYRTYRGKNSPKSDAGVFPVWQGNKIPAGDRVLEVIHIPGHTPGSIALLDKQNRCCFVGDSISTSHIYMFGPGRSLEAYIASLKKLMTSIHQIDTFYCSHGEAEAPAEDLFTHIEGAQMLLAGQLTGEAATFRFMEGVKLYEYKTTAFLYAPR
ncbi:MAG: MBL fold metallo-hydrolase [Clostridiales Family XIII bacterium]|jgi:glyoxylase-like metal-dependent hydrolase (beta-lactamase superfamily II)|nr:MBL fold metallo-hydrolase [Clostridiales Family XIII bacterium]